MKKVLISAPYMHREREKVEAMFEKYRYDLTWIPVEERLEEKDLVPIISGYEGIICGDDRITKNVLDKAINLKVIVKWGTGIDSIDSEYAKSKGIAVKRTLDAFTEPVSDTTLAMMLADTRALFVNDRVVKSGGWDKPQGYTLGEKVIGIIGYGNTGKAVAKRIFPFGSKVLVNDIIDLSEEVLSEYNVTFVDKETIFDQCDIITVHCDLNETSKYLLNRDVFKKMRKKPFIVNCARGPIIKEDDMIWALKEGIIRGAGLDVFEHEPLPVNSPLREMENVIASCHNSNSSPLRWDDVHANSIKMLNEELGEG